MLPPSTQHPHKPKPINWPLLTMAPKGPSQFGWPTPPIFKGTQFNRQRLSWTSQLHSFTASHKGTIVLQCKEILTFERPTSSVCWSLCPLLCWANFGCNSTLRNFSFC